MKTPPKSLTRAVAFASAFLLGLVWACPWDRLAETVLAEASRKASTMGMKLDYGSAVILSHLPPRVEIRDLAATSLLGALKAPTVNLELKTEASLFTLSPTLEINSPAATLTIPGNSPLKLSGMRGNLSLGRTETRFDPILVEGDLAVSGKLAWSPETRRLSVVDLAIRAPESLSASLNLLGLSEGLRPEGKGQWRWKRP